MFLFLFLLLFFSFISVKCIRKCYMKKKMYFYKNIFIVFFSLKRELFKKQTVFWILNADHIMTKTSINRKKSLKWWFLFIVFNFFFFFKSCYLHLERCNLLLYKRETKIRQYVRGTNCYFTLAIFYSFAFIYDYLYFVFLFTFIFFCCWWFIV